MLNPANRFALTAFCALTFLITAATPAARAQEVKFEKYKLDNGLTVILHEDHRVPVVAVNLWYRVGAKEEQRGRSGFAHLFEHLMFMGTQRVPGSDFDITMESGGGSNNASTTLDRTNYYSSGPSSLLPTLLWLDADRMEDVGRTMSQEKLDKQRDIVRNEIRQNVENSPYQRSSENLYRIMYPVGHPYHEAVYGTHADLEAATVLDVKDFFATYYVPRNCALVVAGDFDAAKIKPLIESLYGSLPAGAPVVNRQLKDWPAPVLGKVVRSTMLDKVDLPQVTFCYHSPPQYAAGDAEMDLLADVLGQGKSSRLYKRLVMDDKVASGVSVYQNSAALGSMFTIDVQCVPGTDLDAVERTIDEELARLVKDGPSSEELDQRKATIELSMLSRLDNLGAKADQLNAYEYAFGDPGSFKRDLDRYRSVTPASLKEWSARVLTPGSRAIVRVLPEEPDREKSGRDARPADQPSASFTPVAPETFTLSNGVPVWFWKRSDLPLVAAAVQVMLPSRGPLVSPGKAGLAVMTADMLDEGAGALDATQFADAVQSLGATMGAGADHTSFSVGTTVLKRNFPKAAALLADSVQRPRLTDSDFERVRRLHLDDLEQSLNDPSSVASNVASRAFFGDKNPYGLPSDGLVETASSVTIDDIRQLHAGVFSPANARLFISGDLSVDEAKTVLEKEFGGWKAQPGGVQSASADLSVPAASGTRVVIVDRPEAVQTVIRIIMPGPDMTDPARAEYSVLNTLFGGSFTSRLNANIREEHGYAYGAGSGFMMEPKAGAFSCRAAVKADVTGPALAEFLKELARLNVGDITDDEAAKARQTVRTETIQDLSGLRGPMTIAADRARSGLGFETVGLDLTQAAATTTAALNARARTAAPMDRAVIVLVGDKKLILEQIKPLKLPAPIELTPEGEPVREGQDGSAAGGSAPATQAH